MTNETAQPENEAPTQQVAPNNDLLASMDKGPWEIYYDDRVVNGDTGQKRIIGLLSDDFEHDVLLRVSGDFATYEDRHHYCKLLAAKLNSAG